MRPALEYLALYVTPGMVSDYAGSTTYARLWGVGMAIEVLARTGRFRTANLAAATLHKYELSKRPFGYGQRPGEATWYPRQNAYLLLGLISLEQYTRSTHR